MPPLPGDMCVVYPGVCSLEEAPAGIALVDVAGTWNVRSSLEGSETVVTYDLVATGDRSGWSFQFPGREPIPMRVVLVDGDSIVTEAGPFESALRAGVMVNVRTVSRLQDGRLVAMVATPGDATRELRVITEFPALLARRAPAQAKP